MKMIKLFGAALVAAVLFVGVAKADTTLTVQAASKSGVNVSSTSTGLVANNAYQFRNDGHTFLLFAKSGAGASTIAVGVQATFAGMSVSSQNVTVPATIGNVVAGPFPPALFNDANGDTHFTISDTVGLGVSILKL